MSNSGIKMDRLEPGGRKGIKAVIYITLIALIAMGAFVFSYGYVIKSQQQKDVKVEIVIEPADRMLVEIPMGSGTAGIAAILKANDVIRYPLLFKLMSRINGYDGSYQSGTHAISKKLDYDKLMRVLTSKPENKRVTIPEGLTVKQMSDIYSQQGVVEKDKFLKAVTTEKFNYKFLEGLPKRDNPLEGYLFPDTYEFDLKVSEKDIVKRMLENFNTIFKPEYYERTKKINMTVDKVIIMASIVEREVKSPEERKIVAGVFYNRLNRKIRLESCATIQYILGKDGITREKITEKDTKISDPYNTYQIDGLPPGPICSPGKASIEAALNPEKHDYLYFVAKGDGTHYFSKTLAEHTNAMKKYGVN